MRKIKAWLVSDITDYTDSWFKHPVIAFTDEDMARECARKRTERVGDEFNDTYWSEVEEIELVICDGR